MFKTWPFVPILVAVLGAATPVAADQITLSPVQVTDWKAVYGRIETRDRVPARARLGGTLTELDVAEGDRVAGGDRLGRIVDEKLEFRLRAIDAQMQAAQSRLENAQTELTRGEELLERGVTTVQRLDSLRTQVSVISNEIAAAEAERRVVEQQVAEGSVFAPVGGVVLDVPVTVGAVVTPGETVATIGGGGVFLRLAVPERHAGNLVEGDEIFTEGPDGPRTGRLAKIYPQIENGRVIADVEVPGLSERYVDARVLVRLPLAQREALLVPEAAVITRSGLDFVRVATEDGPVLRSVVIGPRHEQETAAMVEILTGLLPGDVVVTDHE
ncbi:RND family efflux transporter, MFP subunit [Roseovarius litoreus]|uniref:RND family efflux transporter, MFP subunit n=1 Tax=Roseovarius litoreus TaxID=1155722 RepID=A0A1M7AU57_9RHOB|nr:efflux RND transporter periplasmic adaptor subunit [Roseovarius litoreus]SHL46156.1 RND family efflux transporter, MFP subunit [Roseovarius litoreus]